MEGRVAAPFEALVGRETAGALAFEENDAFAEGVMVVVLGGGRRRKEEEEEENGGGGRKEWRNGGHWFVVILGMMR